MLPVGETEHAAAQRREAWEGREGLLEEGTLNLAQRTGGGGGAWMDRAEGGEKCVSGRESEQSPEARQHRLRAGDSEETACPGRGLFLTGPLHLGATCSGGGWMAWPHGRRGARHRSEVLMSRTSGQPICSAAGFSGPGPHWQSALGCVSGKVTLTASAALTPPGQEHPSRKPPTGARPGGPRPH